MYVPGSLTPKASAASTASFLSPSVYERMPNQSSLGRRYRVTLCPSQRVFIPRWPIGNFHIRARINPPQFIGGNRPFRSIDRAGKMDAARRRLRGEERKIGPPEQIPREVRQRLAVDLRLEHAAK